MRNVTVAPHVLRLAMAVCACGLPLVAQNGAEKSFWTLGIYTGPSPFQLSPAAKNPVLHGADVKDMNVDTLAHPFMITADSRYYAFFTAKDLASDKGGIGLAESTDGLAWKFRRTVIREPFVTSHPYVFEWQNEYYMIPEAHTETSVRLYRATKFPDEWKYEGDLIKGDHFISPTLVRYKDLWWMFTVRSGNETLRLFYAANFKGPWTEHPLSPIVKERPSYRKAGRQAVRHRREVVPAWPGLLSDIRIPGARFSGYGHQPHYLLRKDDRYAAGQGYLAGLERRSNAPCGRTADRQKPVDSNCGRAGQVI